jgi:hypothetical protein
LVPYLCEVYCLWVAFIIILYEALYLSNNLEDVTFLIDTPFALFSFQSSFLFQSTLYLYSNSNLYLNPTYHLSLNHIYTYFTYSTMPDLCLRLITVLTLLILSSTAPTPPIWGGALQYSVNVSLINNKPIMTWNFTYYYNWNLKSERYEHHAPQAD